MALLSYIERQIFVAVNMVVLCTLVGLFGIFANVINLIVFYKQGLNSSMNITFFAMAIADLCGLVFQQLFNVFLNPLLEAADLPLMPLEFQYMIAGVPRFAFSKITCLITVYATLERCLCIAFPLHVKQMITPRRTAVVMICIYSLIFISYSPLYYRTSINWKFYPALNKTLLGLVYAADSEKLTNIAYVLQSVIGLISFIAVVVFTAILIRKLREKRTWRESATVASDKSESMSSRDTKTMIMITLIASILIICYTPSVILFCVTLFEPEFSITGHYINIFFATWSFSILSETVNGSVNIILYIKMSTQYRNSLLDQWPFLKRETKIGSIFHRVCFS